MNICMDNYTFCGEEVQTASKGLGLRRTPDAGFAEGTGVLE